MQRINEGKLGDYVFENEDLFSIDEVEILFHSHNYSFYKLEIPLNSKNLVESERLLNPKEIHASIKNTKILL
jgi:hypothetical protein